MALAFGQDTLVVLSNHLFDLAPGCFNAILLAFRDNEVCHGDREACDRGVFVTEVLKPVEKLNCLFVSHVHI